jgi:hypothetical protein
MKKESNYMKIKLNLRFFTIILLIVFASIIFSACNSKIPETKQNLDKGIVEFDNQQYSAEYSFQINQSYFDENGLNNGNFTHLADINGGGVYSIKGLDSKDWIYFNFGNCDVGFGFCKNITTKLDDRYFDFSDTFQLIKYNYTIESGMQEVIDTTIKNEPVVAYAYKIASSNGNSDMGVTSDELTSYSLLLTPKAFPALQYCINYYECETGYYIGSNVNGQNSKVDNSIHEMISRLE